MAKVQPESPSNSKYAKLWSFEMLLEINKNRGSNYVITEEDCEKEEKILEFNSKFANEEEIGSDESIPIIILIMKKISPK
jgi:hypothetical protein